MKPQFAQLKDQYDQFGTTISSLAKQHGVSQPTMRKWLIDYNIPRKSHHQASNEANNRKRVYNIPEREHLLSLYKSHSIDHLESMFSVGQQTIYEWLDQYGIERIDHTTKCKAGKIQQFADIRFEKQLLEQHYQKYPNINVLSDVLGVSYSYTRKVLHQNNIPIVSPRRSRGEVQLVDFIVEQLGVTDAVVNSRKIIHPYEVDIACPSLKLAIEYCGIYWHSEYYGKKQRNYHQRKWRLANQRGYHLLTIFESDDISKVKSLIRKRLGKVNRRIFARNTSVVNITDSDARDFHNQHHLQGNALGSSIHFGLIDDESRQLVYVISFGHSRFSKKYTWECLRMTSHSDCLVVGGPSKLFKHFRSLHSKGDLITYADLRFGNGDVYNHCHNFELLGISKPNYWYFHRNSPLNLHSRVKFQKHKLNNELANFDHSLSEYQNMINNKYDRIWDCGNAVYLNRGT